MKFVKEDFVDSLGMIDTYTEFTDTHIVYTRFGTGFELGSAWDEKYRGAQVFFDEELVSHLGDSDRIAVSGKPLGIHVIQLVVPGEKPIEYIRMLQESIQKETT